MYELEERLLPPGGAPVRCTRCAHVFTAAPAGSSSNTGGTQIFGRPKTLHETPAASAPSPSASPDEVDTGEDDAQEAPSRERTQIYGKKTGTPEPPAQNLRSTLVFGARRPLPSAEPSAPPKPPAPTGLEDTAAAPVPEAFRATPRAGGPSQPEPSEERDFLRNTQIFGGKAARAPDPQRGGPRLHVGHTPSSRDVVASGASPLSPTSSPSGLPPAPSLAAPVRAVSPTAPTQHDLQRSAASAVAAASAPRDPLRTTQLFGTRPQAAPAPPAITSQTLHELPVPPDSRTIDADLEDLRAAQMTEHERHSPFAGDDDALPPEHMRPTAPGLPALQGSAREPSLVSPSPGASSSHPPVPLAPSLGPGVPEEPAFTRSLAPFDPALGSGGPVPAETKAKTKAKSRAGLWLLLLLLLALLGAAGAYLYREYAAGPQPPSAEAIAAHEAALRAVRRDDAHSLAQAAQQLEAVTARWPHFAEARVTHLVAVLFAWEDARVRLELTEAQRTAVSQQLARLRERRQPFDWEAQAAALEETLAGLEARALPLRTETERWKVQVDGVWGALQSSSLSEREPLQWARAQAIHGGVFGTEGGLRMSEEYRAQGGSGGWAEVAFAEYTLNAKVAPESWRKARGGLEAVREQDSSWTRLHVMSGRLALKERNAEAATTSLESALTLNAEHETARLLLDGARKLRGRLAAER